MSSNFTTSSLDGEKPRSPLITWGIVGLTMMGCLCIVVDVFFFVNPDRIPLLVQSEPSATTVVATSTSIPDSPATQPIVTATSQNIEALATDSLNAWPVFFYEIFDSNENSWAVGSDNSEYADVNRQIKDGKYRWVVTSKKAVIAWVAADTRPVSDFRLSVEIKQVSGSDQFDYGVTFRENANGDLYYFGIDNEGFFVLLSSNNEWSDVIAYKSSSLILPGETNRLAVIAQGSHFLFFINDQLAGEATDSTLTSGTAGVAMELLEADLEATFEFDNFELRTP